MYARAVDDAERKLRELRLDAWQEGVVAAAAFVSSLVASSFQPSLALPLFVGGATLTYRAVRACWLRWDMLDELVRDCDAYVIPDVRAAADKTATIESRHRLARSIRAMRSLPGDACASRAKSYGAQLDALVAELDDEALELDPRCAVECDELLTDALLSPLLNVALPAEDLGARVARIRAGFRAA